MRNILLWATVALIAAAGVVSCTTPYEEQPTPIEFATIAKADQSAVSQSSSMVIEDQETWESTWASLVANLIQRPPPPEIDFGDYILLAHFMGQKSTSGYEVEFTEVLEGDEISATVTEISPGSNCTLLQVITSPYQVIEIPKTDKEVEFIVRPEVRPCPVAAWYDWPMYHHDAQHSGGATGRGITTIDSNLQFVFDTRSQAGGDSDGIIYASPVVANDGTIYVASTSEGTGTVYALDSAGNVKTGWPFSIGAEIYTTPAIGPDNTIYLCTNVASTGDNFFALNPGGTIKWKLKVPGGGAVNFSMFSSPALVKEWVAEETSHPWSESIVLRQVIYAGTSDGYLYKIIDEGSSGTIAWGLQLSYTSAIFLGISSPAVGPSGTIYVGILDPTEEVDSQGNWGHWGKIVALNPDGSERWRQILTTTNTKTSGGVYEEVCSPAVAVVHYPGPNPFHGMPPGNYETVFAGTTDHRMKAVRENPSTHQPSLDMDFGASGGIRLGCPAIYDLNGDGWVEVIFGTAFTRSNNLYAVSFTQNITAAPAFCNEYWHFSTGWSGLSGPAVSTFPSLAPAVFIGSMDLLGSNSKIYSIGWDGTIVGTYDSGTDGVWASPAVAQGPTPPNLLGAAGWVFVGSGLGKLYAFGPPY